MLTDSYLYQLDNCFIMININTNKLKKKIIVKFVLKCRIFNVQYNYVTAVSLLLYFHIFSFTLVLSRSQLLKIEL